MPYVYSTGTNTTAYVKYKDVLAMNERGGPSHNQIVKKVIVHGGHGVANKHFVTPVGVATHVSDEDLEFLLSDPSFQRHVKAGFVTYDKKKVEPYKKAANMAQKDGSSPLTPKEFEKGENDSDDLKVYKGIVKNRPL